MEGFMKKVIAMFVVFVLILSMLPIQIAYASQGPELLEIIRFEDGSYLEITLESASQTRASGSLTKTKNYTKVSTEGTTEWKISLTGSFTYTGTTSTCTAASCNVTIYQSNWSVASKSASKSGNTAYGTARILRKYLGATVSDKTYNLTLTCDKNGNVS